MAKVLVITGYLSDDDTSNSKAALDLFLKYYQAKNSADTITIMNLNHDAMATKTLTHDNMATFFNEQDSDKYIDQLKAVDKVIMVTPMINFSPSPLIRNYFDHIMVANKTFSYKYAEKGKSKGLLDHLKVEVIIAQGSPEDWYTFTRLREFVPGLWQFVGATINGVIMIDGTKTDAYRENGGISHALSKLDSQIKADAEKF